MSDRFSPVSFQFKPDAGPGRFRIGLILLSNDYATERDFSNARPSDDVAVFCSRVRNASDCSPENLALMEPLIGEAADLILPEGRLDAIAYSCTSGTIAIGYERICGIVQTVRPGIKVVTPITASFAAFDAFNITKIAVLTPYTDAVNDLIYNHLCSEGIEICRFSSFGIEDNEVMAALPPEAIYQAALEADHPDAQALFISCTAIRAMDIVERLEAELGKPVVTANQAMIWQALRHAGCTQTTNGYGQLLRR